MSHFLDIHALTCQQVQALIDKAFFFKNGLVRPNYSQYTVANLFYENSTRTRVSFELAANQLNMPVINLDLKSSSVSKGESVDDTIRTLAAMGISIFVMRHQEDRLVHQLAHDYSDNVHLVNAGDGCHAHPSQALLDMMTIMEHKQDLTKLKIALIGDIRHSRVANSFQCLSRLLGVGELVMAAPDIWKPDVIHYGYVTHSLNDALKDADVVMCLRVQKERLNAQEAFNMKDYRRDFSLTSDALKKAKTDAIVMHPGPVNRGIEIDTDVADGKQSVILKQAQNGVFARMAILQFVLQ